MATGGLYVTADIRSNSWPSGTYLEVVYCCLRELPNKAQLGDWSYITTHVCS
jgi:hypothetical protein